MEGRLHGLHLMVSRLGQVVFVVHLRWEGRLVSMHEAAEVVAVVSCQPVPLLRCCLHRPRKIGKTYGHEC